MRAEMPKKGAGVGDGDDLGSQDEIEWNGFGSAADQGPGGYSAIKYSTRIRRIAIETNWCAPHGSWRDMQVCLKEARLWSYFLCLIVCMNIVHGPGAQDQHHMQATQVWPRCGSG